MRVIAAALLMGLSSVALANTDDDIPLSEHEFVARVQASDKAEIVAKLGEPARSFDVKDQDTGEVMGTIWHYYNLNTAENGDYYKTTELDFVGDKVVTVVFSTQEDDGSEAPTPTPADIPGLIRQ